VVVLFFFSFFSFLLIIIIIIIDVVVLVIMSLSSLSSVVPSSKVKFKVHLVYDLIFACAVCFQMF